MDTIFAVATPPGRGGVGVVRVSGPIIDLVCQSLSLENIPDRTAVLRTVAYAGQTLDQALVLRFPHGASFTGEDVLELHLHGSPAVRDAVLGVLASVDGCRPAEPGEFTRRALENGRMDLTEVEGLSALIDAETEAQRKQAQRLVSGGLAKLGDDWRDKIIEALALLEVTIDFADEEVPVDVRPDVIDLIGSVVSDLRREIGGVEYAERVREGFEVAIVGAPNAGKSTLLNALAGRDAALTSDIAGTTRDIIEVRMNLSGIPVTVLDTAGLRSSDDEIETMGVERAVARAASADLRVFLESDGQTLDMVEEHPDDIRIWGKSDAHNREGPAVSGLTGDGIDSLIERIVGILQDRVNRVGTATDDRHRAEMTTALNALELGLKQLSAEDDRIELASEEIRTAARALDRMIGRVDVESILDQIFSRFCLGK